MDVYLISKWQRAITNRVSKQTQKDNVYIKEQSKSITHGKQVNQLVNQSIMKTHMWGPHQSPIYFSMNLFHKFHYLELRNSILAYLKHFENQRNCESHWPKKEWRWILFEKWIFETKTLRMKFQKKELKSFEKYLKTGIYGIALKLKMVKDEIK